MTIKQTIMDTAAKLFLEKGIHGTSTKAIVDAVGVSNGALFNHFANKDELVLEIYKQYKNDLREALYHNVHQEDGIRKFIYDYWCATIHWALDNLDKKKFILTFALQPNVISCTKSFDPARYDFLLPKISKAIADKEIIADNLNYFIHVFSGITDGIINYLATNPQADRDQVIDTSYAQFWRSIVNF